MVTFRHGETMIRDRRGEVIDPYSGLMVAGDWDPTLTATIENVAVAPSTSVLVSDATRTQIITSVSAYADYHADVRPGDRLTGPSGVWLAEGEPARWRSPYTGREEGLEIRIERVDG